MVNVVKPETGEEASWGRPLAINAYALDVGEDMSEVLMVEVGRS